LKLKGRQPGRLEFHTKKKSCRVEDLHISSFKQCDGQGKAPTPTLPVAEQRRQEYCADDDCLNNELFVLEHDIL
jgi:hypothetical protein